MIYLTLFETTFFTEYHSLGIPPPKLKLTAQVNQKRAEGPIFGSASFAFPSHRSVAFASLPLGPSMEMGCYSTTPKTPTALTGNPHSTKAN